jgi:soluble lytic murein transglycosylase-like protein
MAFVALACAASGARAAGVYKWIDKQGVTHYTNVPGDQQASKGGRIESGPAETSVHRSSIYKFRDANGITHYTDRKPRHANYVVISVYCPACDPRSPVNWNNTPLNPTAYAPEIGAAALRFGVDPAFVRAIMHAESAFNPDARSRKGAQGLMQLMPATAAQYGVTNAFDATANIQGGVQHLAGLLLKYSGDVKLAAAAYNAGEGAVAKYGGVPPYDETRVYVERVGILLKRYQDSAALATALAPVQPAMLNP